MTLPGELSRTYVNKYGAGKSCVKKGKNREKGEEKSEMERRSEEILLLELVKLVQEKLLQCRIDFLMI